MNNSKEMTEVRSRREWGRSFIYQTGLLTAREFELLKGRPVRTLLLIALPLLCGVVVTLVVGEDMFTDVYMTQTGFFTLSCAMAFTGIFNSMQEVCRERSILRREYAADLRLDSYIWSKLIVQTVLCAVQSLLVLWIFSLKVKMTGTGILMSAFMEYYITLFLLSLSSAATGLLISSVVRSGDIANTVAPIFLVMQILFSGMLVVPKSFIMKAAAKMMVSYWALGALCSVGGVGEMARQAPLKDDRVNMMIRDYSADKQNIILPWAVLLLVSVSFSAAGGLLLKRVSKDKR